MNQDVTGYIDGLAQPRQVALCTAIRQRIHDAVPDVEERLQYKSRISSRTARTSPCSVPPRAG